MAVGRQGKSEGKRAEGGGERVGWQRAERSGGSVWRKKVREESGEERGDEAGGEMVDVGD